MITSQNYHLNNTILCQRYYVSFKYLDLNITADELGLAYTKEDASTIIDDDITLSSISSLSTSLSMGQNMPSFDNMMKPEIDYLHTISAVKELLEFATWFAQRFSNLVTLFCLTSLEKIRYLGKGEQMIYEYIKRWCAFVESLQHLDSQLVWFNNLYNSLFDSLYEFRLHPIYPRWSIATLMARIWRAKVLMPLITEDKIDSYLIKLMHSHILKYVNTLLSSGVKDTTVFPPSKLKMLFDNIIVDLSCNEKNIYYLGDSKKFYSDNILVEAEKQIIDNLKVFLTTCVNEKQELDTGYDICMRYMEQVTGVYPVSLENRVHTEILLHLEKFIRGKLKITCDNKFKELCVKPMQDICEVIITEEYMRKEQPYSLGNLIKRLVEEFMEKHEKAMLVPYGKEYFIKAILYFLKSTFNEENEKWCLVVWELLGERS